MEMVVCGDGGGDSVVVSEWILSKCEACDGSSACVKRGCAKEGDKEILKELLH